MAFGKLTRRHAIKVSPTIGCSVEEYGLAVGALVFYDLGKCDDSPPPEVNRQQMTRKKNIEETKGQNITENESDQEEVGLQVEKESSQPQQQAEEHIDEENTKNGENKQVEVELEVQVKEKMVEASLDSHRSYYVTFFVALIGCSAMLLRAEGT